MVHYFITGHTGFKGSWLTLLLTELGHNVSGLALEPDEGSLFQIAQLTKRVTGDYRGDIRDPKIVYEAIMTSSPDVVIHMAAQPLVRESYVSPRFTLETNVNGTLNVLEAVGQTGSVQAQVVVTTDKVYRNIDEIHGYREHDSLGGRDPYSASKSMADILTQSWTESFPGVPTAIARAGNVIGGGDVCRDRLMPDLMRAFSEDRPALIRFPSAVRPWQHVLDCLNGYLMLVDRLLADKVSLGAWNFGPESNSVATVEEVSRSAARLWGSQAEVKLDHGHNPHEAMLLVLDSSRARRELQWVDRLELEESIEWTVAWTKYVSRGDDPLQVSLDQAREFFGLMRG